MPLSHRVPGRSRGCSARLVTQCSEGDAPPGSSGRLSKKETFPGCELRWIWRGSKKVGCALNSRLSEIGTALGPGISANLRPGRGDLREELGKT